MNLCRCTDSTSRCCRSSCRITTIWSRPSKTASCGACGTPAFPNRTRCARKSSGAWRLQRQGSMLPFAVIEKSTGMAVGMTTFMNIDAANRHVEIGSTWYRKRVQRSGLNTECKLLLLTHAFERVECIAVEFRTHSFNRQSRAAIERLGAKLDGVLRQHQIAPQRHAARHLRLQHSRPRVADGEGASHAPAEPILGAWAADEPVAAGVATFPGRPCFGFKRTHSSATSIHRARPLNRVHDLYACVSGYGFLDRGPPDRQ